MKRSAASWAAVAAGSDANAAETATRIVILRIQGAMVDLRLVASR